MSVVADSRRTALADALTRLRGFDFLPDAIAPLELSRDRIDNTLRETVLEEIPAFVESSNPVILPSMAQHGPQHSAEIIRLLNGGRVGDFDFVKTHLHLRAEQRFPLEATLHAYRCGHKVFMRWLREAMLEAAPEPVDTESIAAAVADFTVEYTDAVSTIATSAYIARTRLMAELVIDQRAELINTLLDGYDESDGRVAKLLRDAGYLDKRQSFCVVLARSVDPVEMQNASRARRVADAMDEKFRDTTIRRIVDVRDNRVVIIFSAQRRASGWTAPSTKLAVRISERLPALGTAVLCGVSNDVPATAQIPLALRQARLALDAADVTQRVKRFSDISVQQLILQLADDEIQGVLPPWAADFGELDRRLNGAVFATLRAYADADMNVLKTATTLAIHPNTIYARFQKIADVTTIDPKSFHGLNELLIVASCQAR